MERRVWRARAQGGYIRVFEYEHGNQTGTPITVSRKVFGEQVAAALNAAYMQGVADSRDDHAREVKQKLADLLAEMGHEKAADIVRQAPA